jgi:hypothetical protein
MVPVSEPSWRKPVGVLALLVYLALYAILVASLADWLSSLPMALMVAAYVVFGLAWVLPLKPLFVWMNTGRWSRS